MKKENIIIIVLVCLMTIGTLLGYFLGRDSKKVTPTPPVVPDIIENTEKIDSLSNLISYLEEENKVLQEEIKKKKTVVIVKEIEKIIQLPSDENNKLLEDNLKELGELTQLEDSIKVIDYEDSRATLLSENNVKDVNIISAKLRNELEINGLYEERVQKDSLIILSQSGVIDETNIIMQKNEDAYKVNLESLQKSLNKEKRNKVKRTVILGTTTSLFAILTGALILKQ